MKRIKKIMILSCLGTLYSFAQTSEFTLSGNLPSTTLTTIAKPTFLEPHSKEISPLHLDAFDREPFPKSFSANSDQFSSFSAEEAMFSSPEYQSKMQYNIQRRISIPFTPNKTIRILVLDGGGIRALVELEFLKYIENKTGQHITELFNIIGGTSAGGQIATLLGIKDPKTNKQKYSAAFLLDYFLENFPKAFETKGKTFFGLMGEKYKTTPLKNILHKLSGNISFKDLMIPVVTTAYDLSPKKHLYQKHLTIFSSRGDQHVSALDVMLATSAAPSYFKSHKMNGKEYADGGLIMNNPVVSTLNEAKRIYPHASSFIVLSLGTGTFPDIKENLSSLQHVSLISIAKNIPHFFLQGQNEAIEESLKDRPDLVLFRFNPIIRGENIDLDDTSQTALFRLRTSVLDMITSEQTKIDSMLALLPKKESI